MPTPPPRDPPYTGWHFLFIKLLEATTDPRHLEVKSFDKLGDLPLEADAVVLRKLDDDDLLFRSPDLAFLGPYLRRYTVLEFKSPQDRLTAEDFDTGRAYCMLAKRKYAITSDEDIGIIWLASAVSREFYDVCRGNGYPFLSEGSGQGVMSCRRMPLRCHVLNLLHLGEAYPQSLINLLSPRRRIYRLNARNVDPRSMLALDLICATLTQELRTMLDKHKHIPALGDLSQDLNELRRQVMALHTVEDRLEGLSPEDLLRGLSKEQRAELLRLLTQEQ